LHNNNNDLLRIFDGGFCRVKAAYPGRLPPLSPTLKHHHPTLLPRRRTRELYIYYMSAFNASPVKRTQRHISSSASAEDRESRFSNDNRGKGRAEWPCPLPSCPGHLLEKSTKNGTKFLVCDEGVFRDTITCAFTGNVLRAIRGSPTTTLCLVCLRPIANVPSVGTATGLKLPNGKSQKKTSSSPALCVPGVPRPRTLRSLLFA